MRSTMRAAWASSPPPSPRKVTTPAMPHTRGTSPPAPGPSSGHGRACGPSLDREQGLALLGGGAEGVGHRDVDLVVALAGELLQLELVLEDHLGLAGVR